MDTTINYWAVLGGAIFLFIMGMIWYGPLFGKLWRKIVGAEHMSKEEMAKMQKEMMPMYLMTIVLGFITSYVLYTFVHMSGMGISMGFWIWLGFQMPLAAGSMWDTKKGMRLSKFLVTGGYQLVTLIVLAWAYTMW